MGYVGGTILLIAVYGILVLVAIDRGQVIDLRERVQTLEQACNPVMVVPGRVRCLRSPAKP